MLQPQEGRLEQEDPGNKWVLGAESDLLQLRMAGSVPTPSGYVGLLLLAQSGSTGDINLSSSRCLVTDSASEWETHVEQNPVGCDWREVSPNIRIGAWKVKAWTTGRIIHAPSAHLYVGNAKQKRPGVEIIAYG